MSYAEQVKAEVSKLPQAEQSFYDSMIKRATDDPFDALKHLNESLDSGGLGTEYRRGAALARSAIQAIIKGAPDKPDRSDSEKADQDIMARAMQLEKEGRHGDAMRLYEAIRVSNEKEAEQLASLDNSAAVRDAQAEVFRTQKLVEYHEALEKQKFAIVDRHMNTGRDERGQLIDREEAERRYEKDNRSRLEASLQRNYGLTPADVVNVEGVHGNGTG